MSTVPRVVLTRFVNASIHPMKVLFMIPTMDPPVLDGNFSPRFVNFVSCCLQKAPQDRPTASELLQHPFIGSAGLTSLLTKLLDRNAFDGQQHDRKGGKDVQGKDGDLYNDRVENGLCRSTMKSPPPPVGKRHDATLPMAYGHYGSGKGHTRDVSVGSAWDFDTVRLSSTSLQRELKAQAEVAATVEAATTIHSDKKIGGMFEDERKHAAVDSTVACRDLHHDEGGKDESGEDKAFDDIVKPAISEVLERVLHLPTTGSMSPTATEVQEDLLFELLHVFDNVSQQKGLLRQVLQSLAEYTNARMPVSSSTNAIGSAGSTFPKS